MSTKHSELVIPVIDISLIFSPAAKVEELSKIYRQIDDASKLFGFFQVVGHGIPIDPIVEECKNFFNLPSEAKQKLARLPETPFRGYFSLSEHTKNKLDLKAGFDYAAWPTKEGNTVWPEGHPKIKKELLNYFNSANNLSEKLLEIYSINLGKEKTFFKQFFTQDEHLSFTRLNYYPCVDTKKEEKEERVELGVNPHQDGVALTILKQDDSVSGLQVYIDDAWDDFSNDPSKWITVEPVKGALVVNVGAMLEVWSNKRYKAALHQVLASKNGRERYSIPFFYSPNPSADVIPITKENELPVYKPINYGEYRELLFRSFNEPIPIEQQARLPNYLIK